MSENESIIELIEALYNMIADAWGVPLGQDKCLIERDKALELIEEIKSRFPAEMAEAKRLVSARDEFIGNAKKEADSVRKLAEEKSKKLVDEQEIVIQAKARAEQLVAEAQDKADAIRNAATNYVDETLRGTENSISSALETIRLSRSKFHNVSVNKKV